MKQLGELVAADLMSEHVTTIDQHERLTTAIKLMDDQGVSALPVLDENDRVIGVLSHTDLVDLTREIQSDLAALALAQEKSRDFLIHMLVAQGDDTKVVDVMTEPVETITPTTNVVVAAREMVERGFRHLPVSDDQGHAVGMLSTTDFVRAFAKFGALLAG